MLYYRRAKTVRFLQRVEIGCILIVTCQSVILRGMLPTSH